jgi:hypothetical protein
MPTGVYGIGRTTSSVWRQAFEKSCPPPKAFGSGQLFGGKESVVFNKTMVSLDFFVSFL